MKDLQQTKEVKIMAAIYVALIKKNIKTIDQVPEELREQAQELLSKSNK